MRNDGSYPNRSSRRERVIGVLCVGLLAAGMAWSSPASTRASSGQDGSGEGVRGSWQARSYHLKDGTRHRVDGLIFFSEQDWMVLFFVVDSKGEPQRGSAEGGRYELNGSKLTFYHQYHYSHGEAMEGLAAQSLRMAVREASEAPDEPCAIEVDGDALTIRLPSGNSMSFERSSS